MKKGIFFYMAIFVVYSILINLFFFITSCYSKESIQPTFSNSFYSKYLQAEIVYFKGTASPYQAEKKVLPFMKKHAELFRDKVVLDIGTGCGVMALYAAKLGARKVVATDINKAAIDSTQYNAEKLKFSKIIETRLVPLEDKSAFSVIRDGERFDVIISNPPYSLDVDISDKVDAIDNEQIKDRILNCTDDGDLGFSIIRGLKDHLTSNGVAILLYDSYFYHQVIVKFARYCGYVVKNWPPSGLTSLEAGAIFNSYLKRILIREHVPQDAFNFSQEDIFLMRYLSPPREKEENSLNTGFIIIKSQKE